MTVKTICAVSLLLTLAACESGSYDPSAHRREDAATGSLMPGVDTGAQGNNDVNDEPTIRTKGSGPGGYGH